MTVSDKVLLVDDDVNVLHGYQRMLGRQFRIDIAIAGQSALSAVARTGPYAVVLSDLRMPQMDGGNC